MKIELYSPAIAIGIGYFTLDSLEYFMKEQYVITIPIAIGRDNKSNLYYDQDIGKHKKGDGINLLKLFRSKTEVDIPIQVGGKKRLKCDL